jgi:hypothetical protein
VPSASRSSNFVPLTRPDAALPKSRSVIVSREKIAIGAVAQPAGAVQT